MGRYFSRVLRAFAVTTLGFGGGVALFVMIAIVTIRNDARAFDYAWRQGLMIGIVFGVLIVAVWLLLDLSARMVLARGRVYKGIFELDQAREINMKGNSKEVLAACRDALLTLPHIQSVSDDSEQMITRALTGVSWRSPGEEIEVEINPVAEDSWAVRCTSKPRSAKAVFDYGKNFENVETWLAKIKSSSNGA